MARGVMGRLYRLLEIPAVYRASQVILAAGADRSLGRLVGEMLGSLPRGAPLLDIGCGPQSLLLPQGLRPVGLDVSLPYVAELQRRGARGVVASADRLPFADGSFTGVWSVGLLHHLPDGVVSSVMEECARVCRRENGYLAILDAVLPRHPWRRPHAWAIRRGDRGRFMRTESQLRALLHPDFRWSTRRLTYTWTGLEILVCTCRFGRASGGSAGG